MDDHDQKQVLPYRNPRPEGAGGDYLLRTVRQVALGAVLGQIILAGIVARAGAASPDAIAVVWLAIGIVGVVCGLVWRRLVPPWDRRTTDIVTGLNCVTLIGSLLLPVLR